MHPGTLKSMARELGETFGAESSSSDFISLSWLSIVFPVKIAIVRPKSMILFELVLQSAAR
jgi:hypothetical protein